MIGSVTSEEPLGLSRRMRRVLTLPEVRISARRLDQGTGAVGFAPWESRREKMGGLGMALNRALPGGLFGLKPWARRAVVASLWPFLIAW